MESGILNATHVGFNNTHNIYIYLYIHMHMYGYVYIYIICQVVRCIGPKKICLRIATLGFEMDFLSRGMGWSMAEG